MMSACRTRNDRQSGFTLIETLAAMALMGLIVSVLATITWQWLPNWNHGFDRIQRSETVSTALDRISADIGASEFMRPNRQTKKVLFNGSESSITFARAALGPSARPGLDVVRIAEAADRDGMVLTRSRAAFMPGAAEEPNFADPVVLLRAPYRVSFSYADSDRVWKDSWHDSQALPAAVLLTVRDAATGNTLPISRVAVIHISASVESVCAQEEKGGCEAKPAAPTPDDAVRKASSSEAGR
jgi:general secretion pathway protein J